MEEVPKDYSILGPHWGSVGNLAFQAKPLTFNHKTLDSKPMFPLSIESYLSFVFLSLSRHPVTAETGELRV